MYSDLVVESLHKQATRVEGQHPECVWVFFCVTLLFPMLTYTILTLVTRVLFYSLLELNHPNCRFFTISIYFHMIPRRYIWT